MRKRSDVAKMGLPLRTFLYTLDQIATMLEMTVPTLKAEHIHFEGRSVGPRPYPKMLARNIAEPGSTPDWRVVDQEFARWLKYKGFVLYEQWVQV